MAMTDNHLYPCNRSRMLTIDDLPDDVLLEIFNFYVVRYQYLDLRQSSDYEIKGRIESWQPLVHVCRRWRCLVFRSPRRLNLQLCCTTKTPARMLDVCPDLPLVIRGHINETSVDNVIAVLEHSDRISTIDLDRQAEKLWTAMQVPFPELAILYLSSENFSYMPEPDLPGSFMGGSAPRLRYLWLDNIPFPGLPKLLLSATHLVRLRLSNVPHSGSISPETMVTCLSTLTSLETLQLEHMPMPFLPHHLDFRLPFPPTRSVLPSLTTFLYQGVTEYMEEIVARIDTPQLYRLSTTFFYDFKAPGLTQFIRRTPTLGAYDEAHLTLDSSKALVTLCQSHPEPSDHGMVQVRILCVVPDLHLSNLVLICTLSLRSLLTMENLYIGGNHSPLVSGDDIENNEWLDLLLPFTAVKNLYLSKPFSPCIAFALEELTGRSTTEVLPALENVLLEGFQPSEPVADEGISRFISARQLTNRPVAISVWDETASDMMAGRVRVMGGR